MRIGLVVDGQAEFRSLGSIFSRIDSESTFLKPLYADMQPNAAPAKIVKATRTHLQVFAKKRVDRVVVCLDHEHRPECPCDWAHELEREFEVAIQGLELQEVLVVLKMRMYENWLVSDIDTLKVMRSRFSITNAHEKQVLPDRADSADATHILKAAAQKVAYNKVNDAVAIMKLFDPYAGAVNSRSLRKFLRTLNCKKYSNQSRRPAA